MESLDQLGISHPEPRLSQNSHQLIPACFLSFSRVGWGRRGRAAASGKLSCPPTPRETHLPGGATRRAGREAPWHLMGKGREQPGGGQLSGEQVSCTGSPCLMMAIGIAKQCSRKVGHHMTTPLSDRNPGSHGGYCNTKLCGSNTREAGGAPDKKREGAVGGRGVRIRAALPTPQSRLHLTASSRMGRLVQRSSDQSRQRRPMP